MQWLNEPARWSREGGTLTVTADAGTDFWRTTGYGYVRDNGHLYGELMAGDFDLSVRLRGSYAAQYDQAGIMVRVDARNWLKAGVEFVDGQPRFSTVITRDYSSWAVGDLPPDAGELRAGGHPPRRRRRGPLRRWRHQAPAGRAGLPAAWPRGAGRGHVRRPRRPGLQRRLR